MATRNRKDAADEQQEEPKVADLEGQDVATDVTPDPVAEQVEPLDNGYADVSGALEQAQKDQEDPERDPETGIAKVESAASAALQDEQSKRATGSGEGGGRWPAELLQRNYMQPQRGVGVIPEYTSHLEAEDG